MMNVELADAELAKAQKRIIAMHTETKGGWRAVASRLRVNVRFAYEFAMKGKLPKRIEIRDRLLNPGRRGKAMTDTAYRLLCIVKEQHVGKANGIKSIDLVRALFGEEAADKSKNNLYDRQIREMVAELNREHGALICSTPADGYFYASTLSEGLGAVERLEKRARTQLSNVNHLKGNLKRSFGGQLSLIEDAEADALAHGYHEHELDIRAIRPGL